MKIKVKIIAGLAGAGLLAMEPASGQGTAFNYQGLLTDGAKPANGIYDLAFAIYDSASAGTQQGGSATTSATTVSNGVFSALLDFGNQFPGAARWLQIGVRTNGAAAFSALTPRQPLTLAPYSIFAANAGNAGSAGAVSAANLGGVVGLVHLPNGVVTNQYSGVNLNGTFSGSFAGANFHVDLAVQVAGPLNTSVSFTANGGTLLVFVSGSGAAGGIAGTVGANILLDDGITVGSIQVVANQTLSHVAFVPQQFVLTGVAAGSHTLQLSALNANTHTDVNDYYDVSVLELPF